MNAAPIIARLQSATTGLRFIGGALDLNESTLQAAQYPALFVVPLGETAEPNPTISYSVQTLTQTWGCILILKSVRTSAATDQTAELHALRQSVRSALLGWQPNADTAPFDFASGELLGLDAGLVLWQDTFTTSLLITA